MERTEILCPECMKKKLLKEKDTTNLKCDECGTEFILKAPNRIVYK